MARDIQLIMRTFLFIFLFHRAIEASGQLPKLKNVNVINRRGILKNSMEDYENLSLSGGSTTEASSSIHFNDGNIDQEKAQEDKEEGLKRSQIEKAFELLPSLFSRKSKYDQRTETGLFSVKEDNRADLETGNKHQQLIPKRINLFELISSSSALIGKSSASEDQLNVSTEHLIKFMAVCEERKDLLVKRRGNRGDAAQLKEIKDKNILDILAQFPTQNISFDSILRTISRIWSNVHSNTHRAIFEEISSWAISTILRNFPSDYWSFLDFVITNDLQFPTYQKAVKNANILNEPQVEFVVDRLLHHLLEFKDEGDREYKFYGKFNIHFMELAMNYPEFSKLFFIQNVKLPAPLFPTFTLNLIFKSVALVEIFSHPNFDPSQLAEQLADIVNFCAEAQIPAFTLAEQVDIILTLNRENFDQLEEAGKIVLMNLISESIGNLLRAQSLFTQIPDKAVYAQAIQGNFDNLLLLLLNHLRPSFTIEEFGFLLSLADRLNAEDPFGTLLTLLGSISVPRAAWSCSDAFSERSLRLHMYIETIISIQDQKLAFKIDPDENPLCTSMRLLGKSKKISWVLTHALNEENYEAISTADMLVIPLLLIQRVFHRDYRKSKVIEKYLRAGKPNYRQLSAVINEILEDQCYGLAYQYPVVEVDVRLVRNSFLYIK